METIWQKCNMLRVYTKPKGPGPDYDEPVVLHADGPTVEQFCNRIHKSIMEQFKYAWVWGSRAGTSPRRSARTTRTVLDPNRHEGLVCLSSAAFY